MFSSEFIPLNIFRREIAHNRAFAKKKMTFYSCEKNPAAGALIDLVNFPPEETEVGLTFERDVLKSFLMFEIDYWSSIFSHFIPNKTWKNKLASENDEISFRNMGSKTCSKQSNDASSYLKAWFEEEIKKDPVIFVNEPQDSTWKSILDVNQLRAEKELLKSWTPNSFNIFEWLRAEKSGANTSRFKDIQLEHLYGSEIVPEFMKSEQGAWWVNDFEPLPLNTSCQEFEKKQLYLYKSWMNPQLAFMKRDTEKRIQTLGYWSKTQISRREAMYDHTVFQILDSLSNTKTKWETIQYKTPSLVLKKELHDLKTLFLFARYMEWFFSMPSSQSKEEEEKISHSYFIDRWKLKDHKSWYLWDNQWSKYFDGKNEEEINQRWNINPEIFTDFVDSKNRTVKIQLHPLALITNVVSCLYEKFQPEFWQCVHAIHEWLCRPRPECYRKRLTAQFPLTLDAQYPEERKRWDYQEEKNRLNDCLFLILERYGFACLDKETDTFIDNPLFSFTNRNRICMPESHTRVSLDGYIDSIIPLTNWSKTSLPTKIHTSLLNRGEKLFRIYYGENVGKLVEYFSIAYITSQWTLYGKFFESKEHSNFVHEFKSLDFTRHLVAQYEHWSEKTEPLFIYPAYSLIFAPNDFLFGTMLNFVGKGNFFQSVLNWSTEHLDAERAFYERVKQLQHNFNSWYASYRNRSAIVSKEGVATDKKNGAFYCEVRQFYSKSIMDQFLIYHRNSSPLCLKSSFLESYQYHPTSCKPGPSLSSASEAFNQNLIRQWKKLVHCAEFIDRVGKLTDQYLDQPSQEIKDTLTQVFQSVEATHCFT